MKKSCRKCTPKLVPTPFLFWQTTQNSHCMQENLLKINCLHSYRTENKLKKYYNVCKNHDYCYVEMPKEDNKISKYIHGKKSMKVPFIIYTDMESLLEKISTHNNPEKSSTTKINKHIFSGYSLFTHCLFNATKNKLDCYRGKDCMERFCKDLKEHAAKLMNYEKKT